MYQRIVETVMWYREGVLLIPVKRCNCLESLLTQGDRRKIKSLSSIMLYLILVSKVEYYSLRTFIRHLRKIIQLEEFIL